MRKFNKNNKNAKLLFLYGFTKILKSSNLIMEKILAFAKMSVVKLRNSVGNLVTS